MSSNESEWISLHCSLMVYTHALSQTHVKTVNMSLSPQISDPWRARRITLLFNISIFTPHPCTVSSYWMCQQFDHSSFNSGLIITGLWRSVGEIHTVLCTLSWKILSFLRETFYIWKVSYISVTLYFDSLLTTSTTSIRVFCRPSAIGLFITIC